MERRWGSWKKTRGKLRCKCPWGRFWTRALHLGCLGLPSEPNQCPSLLFLMSHNILSYFWLRPLVGLRACSCMRVTEADWWMSSAGYVKALFFGPFEVWQVYSFDANACLFSHKYATVLESWDPSKVMEKILSGFSECKSGWVISKKRSSCHLTAAQYWLGAQPLHF